MKKNDLPPATELTLTEHLEELRRRLIYIVLILVAGFGLCYSYSELIFDFIRGPIQPYLKQGGLIYTGPMDKFVAHLKVSLLASIVLTCPLWLYQVWAFVAPGLYRKERRYAISFLVTGSFLFVGGVMFLYYLVYPLAFEFLFHYGGDQDVAMITIDEYLSFFMLMSLAFGLAFELPLALVLMVIAGLIDQAFLRRNRRYAIVIISVIAAVVTPPDALSMSMMLFPMLVLYEVSVLIAGFFDKKPSRATQALLFITLLLPFALVSTASGQTKTAWPEEGLFAIKGLEGFLPPAEKEYLKGSPSSDNFDEASKTQPGKQRLEQVRQIFRFLEDASKNLKDECRLEIEDVIKSEPPQVKVLLKKGEKTRVEIVDLNALVVLVQERHPESRRLPRVSFQGFRRSVWNPLGHYDRVAPQINWNLIPENGVTSGGNRKAEVRLQFSSQGGLMKLTWSTENVQRTKELEENARKKFPSRNAAIAVSSQALDETDQRARETKIRDIETCESVETVTIEHGLPRKSFADVPYDPNRSSGGRGMN